MNLLHRKTLILRKWKLDERTGAVHKNQAVETPSFLVLVLLGTNPNPRSDNGSWSCHHVVPWQALRLVAPWVSAHQAENVVSKPIPLTSAGLFLKLGTQKTNFPQKN